MSELAIRTVSETDDIHVIEGMGIPFGGPFRGSDSYRSRATPATNFHWDLFPDVVPENDGTRSAAAPLFIRPTTYQHGLDSDVGLSRVGGWSPIRSSDKGVWVQAQLDKHHEYYAAIRELLDADALGFSIGSAEHSVRFDADRNWVEWPAYELALTPTPSNPWAIIAARTAEFVSIVDATRAVDENVGGGVDRSKLPDSDFAGPGRSFPIVTPGDVSDAASSLGRAKGDREAIKAAIIRIAKSKGADFEAQLPKAWTDGAERAYRAAADDVACATSVQSQLAYLMDCEDDEPGQLAELRTAFEAVGRFIVAESAEIGTPEDEAEEMVLPPMAYMSAIRAGRRNSAADQSLVDFIHDASVTLGATAHASPDGETTDASMPTEVTDDASRSGDPVPTVRITMEPEDPETIRARLLAAATEVGTRTALEVVKR